MIGSATMKAREAQKAEDPKGEAEGPIRDVVKDAVKAGPASGPQESPMSTGQALQSSCHG